MKPHLVIVGGVAAGPKMAAKARRMDPDIPITLVTDEGIISYAACGTPYYLGRVFEDRKKLLVREAEDFGRKNGVTMLTGHRATRIDAAAHTLEIVDLAGGGTRTLEYSKLGLATGARPLMPPIEGLDAPGVFTLRSVTDAFAIDDFIEQYNVRRAVVAGAGFIGLEMVENLRERGMAVTLIELLPQVLPPVDEVVAVAAVKELEQMGADVLLATRVEGLERDERRVTGVLTSRGPVPAELVIMGVGVRPNSELAGEAGLELGLRNTIRVNQRMQTSDPDIYAAGDCAEQTQIVTGEPTWIPLGSTANKQGRVAAVNMAGGNDCFPGVVGTALVRVGGLNIGRTGLQQRDLERLGAERYESCLVPQNDIPGYMPGSAALTLVLHAEKDTRRVVGAQCFGAGEVSKRIDVLATAITAGMTTEQVASLDLGYAPPYAPAMDIVITAANVMGNKLDEATRGVMPGELCRTCTPETVLLDCREPHEWAQGRIAGARLIPLAQIPERAGELPADRPVVVYCKGGLRSADAYRKLKCAGLKDVRYLDGGITCWMGETEG
ncbi:MAG: FAD-dependent oxidoreductase [Armatimonadetes bacterium]|nr:FAD-dependent oxidoreductase [Armatimonadota bacterium]